MSKNLVDILFEIISQKITRLSDLVVMLINDAVENEDIDFIQSIVQSQGSLTLLMPLLIEQLKKYQASDIQAKEMLAGFDTTNENYIDKTYITLMKFALNNKYVELINIMLTVENANTYFALNNFELLKFAKEKCSIPVYMKCFYLISKLLNSVLTKAVRENRLEDIKNILEGKLILTNLEPVALAAKFGKVDIARYFFSIPEIYMLIAKGNYVIRCAAEGGQLDLLKEMIAVPLIRAKISEQRNQVLRETIRNGKNKAPLEARMKVARYLLTLPEVVKALPYNNNLVLKWAIQETNHEMVCAISSLPNVQVNMISSNDNINKIMAVARQSNYDVKNASAEVKESASKIYEHIESLIKTLQVNKEANKASLPKRTAKRAAISLLEHDISQQSVPVAVVSPVPELPKLPSFAELLDSIPKPPEDLAQQSENTQPNSAFSRVIGKNTQSTIIPVSNPILPTFQSYTPGYMNNAPWLQSPQQVFIFNNNQGTVRVESPTKSEHGSPKRPRNQYN